MSPYNQKSLLDIYLYIDIGQGVILNSVDNSKMSIFRGNPPLHQDTKSYMLQVYIVHIHISI